MFFPDESGHLGSGTLLKIEVGLEHRQTAKTSKVGLSYVSLNTNKSGTSAASLSESSCLLHESRTNIIVRMDLRYGLFPLAARPVMAVPRAKGLDEACAWLRKADLTPFSHRSLN
jgi:hypothetical protein